MLKFLKYTIFLGVVISLNACIIGSKNKLVNDVKLNEKLSVTFTQDYKGPGFHSTEEGNDFKMKNGNRRIRFYFLEDSRNLPMEFVANELPDSLPGLDQNKRIGNCQLFYTNTNGMTVMNSTAKVFYHFEKENKFQEVLIIKYDAEKQKHIEKIVASIKPLVED